QDTGSKITDPSSLLASPWRLWRLGGPSRLSGPQHVEREAQEDAHGAGDARQVDPLVRLVEVAAVRAELDRRDAELGGEEVGVAEAHVAVLRRPPGLRLVGAREAPDQRVV